MKRISVIGLGKLGTPFALTAASRGFKVIGLDVNKNALMSLSSGVFSVYEPLIKDLWKKYKNKLSVTADYAKAIEQSDITFVIVPTPSQKNGAFSNIFITKVLKKIAPMLKLKNTFHTIALVSTVVPKSSQEEFIPILEKNSGKRVGIDFGFCYNPAFIALGNVVENLLNPDFVLIGQSDNKSGEIIENFYQKFCINNPPITRTNLANAEIAKLSLNTFITTKISYANMIAQLCEAVPDSDANTVLKTIGQDKRVGSLYLKGAVCYGGPCFPRDNKALQYTGRKVGVELPIAHATDKINISHTTFLVNKITNLVGKEEKVTILGLSYKENTDVTDNSQGILLAYALYKKGYNVMVYDPVGLNNVRRVLGNKVKYAKTIDKGLLGSSIMIVVTFWKEFNNIRQKDIKLMKNPLILDCWGLFNYKRYTDIVYVTVGNSEIL